MIYTPKLHPRFLKRKAHLSSLTKNQPLDQVDVPTPELGGESITEGTIAEWNAKVGRMEMVEGWGPGPKLIYTYI